MRACIAIFIAAFLAACSDADTARRAAESSGLTEVQTTGYRVFGCSDDDTFHTGFTAKNANGKHVSGVVCSGWFKGATVRFD